MPISPEERELEEQLKDAGTKLLKSTSYSVHDLLPLLDQVENLLTRVEQSPAKSMQVALAPLTRTLVSKELLRHANVDVKVAVASCISEITRITAPEAPYEDDQMKDVFQLIVSSFEDLSDESSRSHSKRVTILETVAKVRSCVVMLDLECEALIAEMFTLFLGNIRDSQRENIFTSMETIMTLVLDESEDISSDVLNPLLACLKKDNQEVLPTAVKLAEKVFEKCSAKLKPYLSEAIKSLGTSLDDYSDVVTAVCEGPSSTVEQMNENTSTDQSVVKKKNATSAINVDYNDARPPNSMNGGNDNGNENQGTSMKVVSSVNVEEQDPDNEPSSDKSASKSEDGESEIRKALKFESKIEVVDKPISSVNASESSDRSHVDGKKEVKNQSDPQENPEKDLHDSSTEDDALDPSKSSYTETLKNISSTKGSETDVANISSASQSGSLRDENHPKRVELLETNENLHQEETPSLGKVSEGTRDSETKQHRRSGKRASLQTTKKGKIAADADTSKNESGGESGSEKKQSKQLGEKADESSDTVDDHSSKRKVGSKNHQKANLESAVTKPSVEDNLKKTPSAKSSSKFPKGEHSPEETPTPRMSSKRKLAANQQKVTGNITYDDSLLGSKVKVWWPHDRAYYEGVIQFFDRAKKKHKVVYDDGDVEMLNLKKERWEIINDDSVSSEGHASEEAAGLEAASPMPKREKAKADPEEMVKHGKAEVSSPKRLKGTKSKETTPKSEGKSDDDNIVRSKSHSQRAGDKHVDSSSKKSKDADIGVMSKGKSKQQDSRKTSSKSKQETPKIGSKSNKPDTTSKTGVRSKSRTPDDGNATGLGKVKHSASKTKAAATAESKEKFKEKSSAELQKTPDGAKVRLSEKVQEFEEGGSKKRRRAG